MKPRGYFYYVAKVAEIVGLRLGPRNLSRPLPIATKKPAAEQRRALASGANAYAPPFFLVFTFFAVFSV
jgi:hypothetical protein